MAERSSAIARSLVDYFRRLICSGSRRDATHTGTQLAAVALETVSCFEGRVGTGDEPSPTRVGGGQIQAQI